MRSTLVVDDEVSLVRTLEDRARRHGITNVDYFTSLSEARQAARERAFDRYIADQAFEGEGDDGVTFLEEMKAQRKDADVVLLTGKAVTENVQRRMAHLGGRLVRKQELTFGVVGQLLGGEVDVALPPAKEIEPESTDVGQLRLEVEQLRNEVAEIREINEILIEDVVAELEALPDQEKPSMLIGARMLSPEELKQEVQNRTSIGREMVRMHHELFRMLRQG